MPGLRPGQRDRRVAHVVDRHRAERARDPLAGREQHVHLARQRALGDLVGGGDEVVGRLAARREHGDHLLAVLARGDDPRRGTLDVLGARHRGASELHHHGLGRHRGLRIRSATLMSEVGRFPGGPAGAGAGGAHAAQDRRSARSSSSSLGALGWLIFGGGERATASRRERRPSAPAPADPAAAIVDDLTTEQLVDQLLLVGFDGTDGTAPFLAELRERAIGGVLVRPDNWFGRRPGQRAGRRDPRRRRPPATVPPLIAAAQEGGRYRAFADLPPEETELEIGDAASIRGAERWAKAHRRGASRCGIRPQPVPGRRRRDARLADRRPRLLRRPAGRGGAHAPPRCAAAPPPRSPVRRFTSPGSAPRRRTPRAARRRSRSTRRRSRPATSSRFAAAFARGRPGRRPLARLLRRLRPGHARRADRGRRDRPAARRARLQRASRSPTTSTRGPSARATRSEAAAVAAIGAGADMVEVAVARAPGQGPRRAPRGRRTTAR